MITFALPKGRLAEEALGLFEKAGITRFQIPEASRELVFQDSERQHRYLLVRAQDVGTYVEKGLADVGILGKDVLAEKGYQVYQSLDLKFGYCRLSVAARGDNPDVLNKAWLKVATKYVNLAEDYFHGQGLNAHIIKLYGSVELAPLLGFCDCIVDLVSTGGTLRANGLVEMETIMESTARLIVSRPALSLKTTAIREIFDRVGAALEN